MNFEVAADHPVFAGHFPGRPIVPGVMLLEWAQDQIGQSLGRAPREFRVREAKEQTETPSPYAIPSGCRFHTRCPLVEPICLEQDPPDFPIDSPHGGHLSACHVLPKQ